jgi:hypothetical protein
LSPDQRLLLTAGSKSFALLRFVWVARFFQSPKATVSKHNI